MALATSYLVSIKNFEGIMNSILGARAPERFTNKFLEDLGYKSSNDRLITGVLKSLGFLTDTGEPTQRYFDFLDQTQSKKIMAIGIQEAYEDLFNLNKDAQNLSQDEVRNKLKTLTQGQKGDKVIESMARTFKTLCDYADWTDLSAIKGTAPKADPIKSENPQLVNEEHIDHPRVGQVGLHYNIQIHLPETTNMAVYDAIFQSLKKHLL
jgi:hypothetical protein